MSELGNKLNEILADVEKHIKNPEDLDYVKEQIITVANMFVEAMENITDRYGEKIKRMETIQDELAKRMEAITRTVDEIEKDIYEPEEEESYDFEIVCPYCNHEFVTDAIENVKNEVICPECKNVIELDWNVDQESSCSGSCSHCSGCADEEEIEEYDDDEEEKIDNDEDDDM